uniref:CCHC-type domain-containing protein n=1 Tax=Triticum urartu TaxID=4572 RepID=A0A8R7QUX0_TRIUA
MRPLAPTRNTLSAAGALGGSSHGGIPLLPQAPANSSLPTNSQPPPSVGVSGGPSQGGGNPSLPAAQSSGSIKKKKGKCKKCSDPGHVIEDCPKLPCLRCTGTRHTRGNCTTPAGPVCFRCCDIGHYLKDCVSQVYGRRCTTCGGAGHGDPNNPKHNINCASPPILLLCTSCNNPGHRPRDCPQKSSEYAGFRGLGLCPNCRQSGHVYRDCP